MYIRILIFDFISVIHDETFFFLFLLFLILELRLRELFDCIFPVTNVYTRISHFFFFFWYYYTLYELLEIILWVCLSVLINFTGSYTHRYFYAAQSFKLYVREVNIKASTALL